MSDDGSKLAAKGAQVMSLRGLLRECSWSEPLRDSEAARAAWGALVEFLDALDASLRGEPELKGGEQEFGLIRFSIHQHDRRSRRIGRGSGDPASDVVEMLVGVKSFDTRSIVIVNPVSGRSGERHLAVGFEIAGHRRGRVPAASW